MNQSNPAPPRSDQGDTFLDILKDVSALLHGELQAKIADIAPDSDIHPNKLWIELWDTYNLREEVRIQDIELFSKNQKSIEQVFEKHEEKKCIAFAQALLNTPILDDSVHRDAVDALHPVAAEGGTAIQGWHRLVETLSNYPLDLMPYIKGTYPPSEARINEIVPHRFGLLKNTLGAESNLDFYGYLRPAEIKVIMPEVRNRIIKGIQEKNAGLPLSDDSIEVSASFSSWLKLHEELHKTMYDFAGKTRSINMCKFSGWNSRCYDPDDPNIDWHRVKSEQDQGKVYVQFVDSSKVEETCEAAFQKLADTIYDTSGISVIPQLDDGDYPNLDAGQKRRLAMAKVLAGPFMEINGVHPTREGTSITSQLLFWALAYERGIDFKWKHELHTGLSRVQGILAWEKSNRSDTSLMEEQLYRCMEYGARRNEVTVNEDEAQALEISARNVPIISVLIDDAHPALARGLGLVSARIIIDSVVHEADVQLLENIVYSKVGLSGEQISRKEIELLWGLEHHTDAHKNPEMWRVLLAKASLDYIAGNQDSSVVKEHIGARFLDKGMFGAEVLRRIGIGMEIGGSSGQSIFLTEGQEERWAIIQHLFDEHAMSSPADDEEYKRIRNARITDALTNADTDVAPTAVVVPVIKDKNGLQVIITRRAENISFGGQIGFPGGSVDTDIDRSFVDAAKREFEEELGIPRKHVHAVDVLPIAMTARNHLVVPVLALIHPSEIIEQRQESEQEVLETIKIPASAIIGAYNTYREGQWPGSGDRIEHYDFIDKSKPDNHPDRVQPRLQFMVTNPEDGKEIRIFGATADLLIGLSERYSSVEALGAALWSKQLDENALHGAWEDRSPVLERKSLERQYRNAVLKEKGALDQIKYAWGL